jgi:sugar phosphate isomerase/epimerase
MTNASPSTANGWTADELRERLGISTAIYQKTRLGAREIAAIRANGIRRIELLVKAPHFDFEDEKQVAEVVGECDKQGVHIVSIHANLQLKYHSEDEVVRARAFDEVLRTARFAERIGLSILVGHFGYGDNCRRVVTDLLEKTDGFGVKLTTETMTGLIDRYMPVIDDVASDRFGLTLDIGHVRDESGVNPFTSTAGARETLAKCRDRVIHLHLHETFDLETRADHNPPMHPDGIIKWGEVMAGIKRMRYGGVILFEDGRGEDPDAWCAMTGAFPESFINMYGH